MYWFSIVCMNSFKYTQTLFYLLIHNISFKNIKTVFCRAWFIMIYSNISGCVWNIGTPTQSYTKTSDKHWWNEPESSWWSMFVYFLLTVWIIKYLPFVGEKTVKTANKSVYKHFTVLLKYLWILSWFKCCVCC